MSIEAMSWVLRDAPGLAPHLVVTLMGLANHADHDGRGAYPSQRVLARYARKDERRIRRDLAELMSAGLVAPGDQRMVSHLRADRRPTVYDLAVDKHLDVPVDKPDSDQITGGSTVPPGSTRPVVQTPPIAPFDTPRGGPQDRHGGVHRPSNTSLEPSLNTKTLKAYELAPLVGRDKPTTEVIHTPASADLVLADHPTTQTLVAEWIDHCRSRPPKAVVAQVSKQLAGMLAEGIAADDVRRGVAAWMSKGLHPSTLPSVVNEVMNAPTRGQPKPSTTNQRVAAGMDLVEKYRRMEAIA